MENGYIDRRSVYLMRCEMREGSTALRQWQALFGAGVLACPGGETLILAQSVRGNSASQGDVSEPACSRSWAAHMTGLPDTSCIPSCAFTSYPAIVQHAAGCQVPDPSQHEAMGQHRQRYMGQRTTEATSARSKPNL